MCKGNYAMTVPFTDCSSPWLRVARGLGWVGLITSNSFMKREFGSELIENYLSHVDLCMVIDLEGGWIPGHNSDGTPTVIMIGRQQKTEASTVRAVLSKGRRRDPGPWRGG